MPSAMTAAPAQTPSLPPHRWLRRSALSAMAACLPLSQRVALARVLLEEENAAWFPRPGRLDAVLAHIPLNAKVLELLEDGIGGGRLPRTLSLRATSFAGDLEAYNVWSAAENVAVYAPAVLTEEEHAGALRELSAKDRAIGLVLFGCRGTRKPEMQVLAKARAALLTGATMTPELFRTLVPTIAAAGRSALPHEAHGFQQRLGELLAEAMPSQRMLEVDLPQLVAAQQLASPSRLKAAPTERGTAHLHKLYRRFPPLPELSAFGADLVAGLERRLLDAPEADVAPYIRAIRSWGELDIAARTEALDLLLTDCAAVMGTPKPSLDISEFTGDSTQSYRGVMTGKESDKGRASIALNLAPKLGVFDNFGEAVSVLLHEFTHCHQQLLTYGICESDYALLTPQQRKDTPHRWADTVRNRRLSALFTSNFNHYAPPKPDELVYGRQPVEREAFATQSNATPRVMALLSLLAHRHDSGYLLSLCQQMLGALETVAGMHPSAAPAARQLGDDALGMRMRIHEARMALDDSLVPPLLRATAVLARRATPLLEEIAVAAEESDAQLAAKLRTILPRYTTGLRLLEAHLAEKPATGPVPPAASRKPAHSPR